MDPFLVKVLQRTLRKDPESRLLIDDLIEDLENYINNSNSEHQENSSKFPGEVTLNNQYTNFL